MSTEISLHDLKHDIEEKLAAQGMDAGGGTPQQLAATVRAETARWTDVVRKQNIKVE